MPLWEVRRFLGPVDGQLVMRGVEGFDYETIAEMLEVSPGTVRSRLHRARSQLQEKLSHSNH